jgi:hypothetical protein
MVLKGQAWHDAREKAKRFRKAIAECKAVATQHDYEYEMSRPIEIDREVAEEILSAARNIVNLLSTALEE